MNTHTTNELNLQGQFLRFFLIPFIGSLGIAYAFSPNAITEAKYGDYLVQVIFSFSIWTTIRYGIRQVILKTVDRYLSWKDQPVLKSVLLLTANTLYAIVVILTAYYVLIEWYLGKGFGSILTSDQVNFPIWTSIYLTAIVSISVYLIKFFIHRRTILIKN